MSGYRHAHHGRGTAVLSPSFTDDFNRADSSFGIGNYTYSGKTNSSNRYFNIQNRQCNTLLCDPYTYQFAAPSGVTGPPNAFIEIDLLLSGGIVSYVGFGNTDYDGQTGKPLGFYIGRTSGTTYVFDYFKTKTSAASFPNYPAGNGDGTLSGSLPAGVNRIRLWRNINRQISFGYVTGTAVTVLRSGIVLDPFFDNCTRPMLVAYSNNGGPQFDNFAYGVFPG